MVLFPTKTGEVKRDLGRKCTSFCIPVSENGFSGKQITFSASTCERIKPVCFFLHAFPLWRSSVWVDLTAQISHAIFLVTK